MELADGEEDQKQSDEDRLYNNEEFRAILIRLGFLPSSHTNEVDEQAVQDMWALLRGDANGGVSLDSLMVVLLIIIGIRVNDRERTPEGEDEEPEQTYDEAGDGRRSTQSELIRWAFFDHRDRRFYIRRGYHYKIFTHFKNFYIHRV